MPVDGGFLGGRQSPGIRRQPWVPRCVSVPETLDCVSVPAVKLRASEELLSYSELTSHHLPVSSFCFLSSAV